MWICNEWGTPVYFFSNIIHVPLYHLYIYNVPIQAPILIAQVCKAFALCIKRWGCVARSTQIRKTLSSTVVTMTADNDKVLLKIRETIDSRRCWLADSITPNVIYWWSLLDWISDFFQKHSGSVWIKENDIGVISLKGLINIAYWRDLKNHKRSVKSMNM